MANTIYVKGEYVWYGSIIDNIPHGKGVFAYSNGDTYNGHTMYGKFDGFGKYMYKSGAIYEGFFSRGKHHGIGSFSDDKNIYKGTWRNNKKYGIFYRTKKDENITYRQEWRNDKLVRNDLIQYIAPELLITTKQNPKNRPKTIQKKFKSESNLCKICCDKLADATNTACGHTAYCFACLSKTPKCPTCRTPIETVIKLYVG